MSMSYSHLFCVAGEKMINRKVERVIFYTGSNIDQVRPGDLLMIREIFWDTYGQENFLYNLRQIPIAGMLLHHRCCTKQFFHYYAKWLEQLQHPVLVYDCDNSEDFLEAIRNALAGPDFYGSYILQLFQKAFTRQAYGKTRLKACLQCLEQKLNRTAVFLSKEEAQPQRAETISEDFLAWLQMISAEPDFRVPSFHWYENKCCCVAPVRTASGVLGYLVIFGISDGETYFLRALELLLEFLIPEMALCILADAERELPYGQDNTALLRRLFFGPRQGRTAVIQAAQAAGLPFQKARIAVISDGQGEGRMQKASALQKLYNFLNENYYMVFDSMVVLDSRRCILDIHDSRISPGLMRVSILEALEQFHGMDGAAERLAVSSIAADLSDLGRLKEEAEAALRFGKAFEPDTGTYFYDDYMIYDLFSRSIDNRIVVKLYDDIIKRVTIYDAEHKTALMKTLRALVMSDFNMQATAEKLFIHRNTLYRRIEKLKELLGIDFHSSQNYLILQIAVRLQQLLR